MGATLAALVAASAAWFFAHGYTLYYGDAESHLDVARRIVDSRAPGYEQIGTSWLPMLHALMLPLVRDDRLWRSGVAGILPSAAAYVLAGVFFYALARRTFRGPAPALAGLALFALNPNLLYLASIPMTEPLFLTALLGALAALARLRDTHSTGAALGCAFAALAATLTRYDGWFLLPFLALAVFWYGGLRRAILFSAIAGLGPLWWLGHNAWYYGDPLEFYRGPFSARAIAGSGGHPGQNDWRMAWNFYRAAAELCAGPVLFWMGAVGALAALWKRAWTPLALLALVPVFYLWSVHAGTVQIYTPRLWWGSYYNTRYGLALLPWLALGAAALVALVPSRLAAPAALLPSRLAALVALMSSRLAAPVALLLVVGGLAPWFLDPHAESWICWKESQVNSEARRAWTHTGAAYFREHYRGGGILSPFSDLSAMYREAGLDLGETLHDGIHPAWEAVLARPDLFLHEEWAVSFAGEPVDRAVERANRVQPRYALVRTIMVEDAKNTQLIHIYRRN